MAKSINIKSKSLRKQKNTAIRFLLTIQSDRHPLKCILVEFVTIYANRMQTTNKSIIQLPKNSN